MGKNLMHEGTPRHSGRYPWGSGKHGYQRHKDFLTEYRELKAKGLTDSELAKFFDPGGKYIPNGNELRNRRTISNEYVKSMNIANTIKLKEKGYSNTAIGKKLEVNESVVRGWLKAYEADNYKSTENTANMLKESIDKYGYIDIGAGSEMRMGGISRTKLKASLSLLKDQGYKIQQIYIDQIGTKKGQNTTISVLTKDDVTIQELYKNKDKIKLINDPYTTDGGRTWLNVLPPVSIDAKRIKINYDEDGGTTKDGLIELRPSSEDLSLGDARYAQVRIAVNDSHYLKGMAIRGNESDFPKGIDIIFNTNKSNTTAKMDVLKKMKENPDNPSEIDKDNPFGATIKNENSLIRCQQFYTDKSGKKKQSALNIVTEEGEWGEWSQTIASQVLSKQPKKTIQEQLNLDYARKNQEFEDINNLTNPAIKKRLLTQFADKCDGDAYKLKAAALPRQASKVIIPFDSLKDNECYCPTLKDGEAVALIRYPHGGTFEIPQLKVNNKSAKPKKALGNAIDAIGINSKVAERLSGADFDGDTVLVIPNKKKKIISTDPIGSLKDFNPKIQYKGYEGMKVMKDTGKQMGEITNLITDMTLMGADENKIARAVRHALVVIDAEKHELNYKLSYEENAIGALKKEYQEGGGASTLISRAKSTTRVPERRLGYDVDKQTGERIFNETGREYNKAIYKVNKTTGKKEFVGRNETPTKYTQDVYKMDNTNDARTLLSKNGGTMAEKEYAKYANNMKALANKSRLAADRTVVNPQSKTAKAVFSKELESLRAKVDKAYSNAPLERRAQAVANSIVDLKVQQNPDLKKKGNGKALTRVQSQALAESRARLGAKKPVFTITDSEWNAIQANALPKSLLDSVLNNVDMDSVRNKATPKTKTTMTSSQKNLANALQNSGYTRAEIAQRLGVSITTLAKDLK